LLNHKLKDNAGQGLNHGVQLTPLARVWAGRNLPAKTLRPAGVQTTRISISSARANAPCNPRVGRTRIAWHLPLLAVPHPSDARQQRS